MKICCKCHIPKPELNFCSDKGRKDGLNPRCMTCRKLERKDYYKKNSEKIKADVAAYKAMHPEWKKRVDWKVHLKRKFGLTVEQYEEILKVQGNACAICRRDSAGRKGRFLVDHDHRTGKVRGLLCYPCNIALGYFSDDPMTIRRAAQYLEVHHSNKSVS